MTPPKEIVDAIAGAQSILLATHSPMDGDGMGCGLALMRGLRPMGKTVQFVTEGHIPRAYSFLAGYDEIRRLAPTDPVPACDLVLGLDAGECARLGRACSERPDGALVINVDHHISNDSFGDLNWVDAGAAATGEQVFQLLKALGAEIDADAALALLVSLVTDTGRFCYSNTTDKTLETAAALVRHGADPDRLQRRLFSAIPLNMLRLQARAVDNLEFGAEGLVSMLVIDQDFGADLGAGEEEHKDLIDLVISVQSAVVGALVRGLPEGGCKVSLRSKRDEADVARFAKTLGGGGHIRAAGFSSQESARATADGLKPALEKLAVGATG